MPEHSFAVTMAANLPLQPTSREGRIRETKPLARGSRGGRVSSRVRTLPVEILGTYRVPVTVDLIGRMLRAHWGTTPPEGSKRRKQAMPQVMADL
jgi:hypothetical protein